MTKRLYDTPVWRKMRAKQLAKDPLCSMCSIRDIVTPAAVADHIIPHHDDPELFYDGDNLQSLCAPCHDSRKKMIEKHGYSQACDVDGLPLDPGHRWFRKKESKE